MLRAGRTFVALLLAASIAPAGDRDPADPIAALALEGCCDDALAVLEERAARAGDGDCMPVRDHYRLVGRCFTAVARYDEAIRLAELEERAPFASRLRCGNAAVGQVRDHHQRLVDLYRVAGRPVEAVQRLLADRASDRPEPRNWMRDTWEEPYDQVAGLIAEPFVEGVASVLMDTLRSAPVGVQCQLVAAFLQRPGDVACRYLAWFHHGGAARDCRRAPSPEQVAAACAEEPRYLVRAQAVDAAGRPLPGAELTALIVPQTVESADGAHVIDVARADGDGRIELVVPHRPGRLAWIARAPGYAPLYLRRVPVGEPRLTLEPGKRLVGTVRSRIDREPVAGVEVRVVPRPSFEASRDPVLEWLVKTVWTDGDGRWLAEDLPSGDYDVRFRAQGWRATHEPTVSLFAKEVVPIEVELWPTVLH